MKRIKRLITTAITLTLATSTVFAASPSFSLKANGAIGAYNLSKNPVVTEVPGLSDNTDFDFTFGLKGSFGKEASRVTSGYNTSFRVNLDKLYKNPSTGDGYVSMDAKKGSNFSKIQGMIDWYEANKHKYNLPDNPYPSGEWPTISYGQGMFNVPFINGTTVENAYDVDWYAEEDNNVWAAAEALYNDIKGKISTAVERIFEEYGIKVASQIKQDEYEKLSPELQKMAIIKMEALNSWNNYWKANTPELPVASGVVEFVNLANVMDIKVELGSARLRAGRLLPTARAGQSEFGSSVRFGTSEVLVKGLDAGIELGLAGGTQQRPEIWDTQTLDYTPGQPGELALKLNANYTYELPSQKLNITAGADFVLPDLLATPKNNATAIRFGVHWNDHSEFVNEYGQYLVERKSLNNLIELKDNFEFIIVNTKDRFDLFDTTTMAYGLRNDFYVSAYGLEFRFDTSMKSPRYANKYNNQVEDRFQGRDIDRDFDTANLCATTLIKTDLAFNSFKTIGLDLFTVYGGFDGLLYDSKMIAYGWNTGIEFNLIDFVKKNFTIFTEFSWYNNKLVKVFTDMETLPAKTFLDNSTIKAGLSYEVSKTLTVNLDFASLPSPSRRHIERITSVEASVSIKY